MFTPNAMAIAPIATEAKVPFVIMNAGTAVITTRSPYMVRASFTLWQSSYPLGAVGGARSTRPPTRLVSDFGPGHDSEDAFSKRLRGRRRQDARQGARAAAEPGLVGVHAAREGRQARRADGVHPGRQDGDAVMKNFSDSGLDKAGIKLIGPGDITTDEELPNMGDVALGVLTVHHYSAAADRPANKAFVAAWKKEYGEKRRRTSVGRRAGTRGAICRGDQAAEGQDRSRQDDGDLQALEEPEQPARPDLHRSGDARHRAERVPARSAQVGGQLANVEIETVHRAEGPLEGIPEEIKSLDTKTRRARRARRATIIRSQPVPGQSCCRSIFTRQRNPSYSYSPPSCLRGLRVEAVNLAATLDGAFLSSLVSVAFHGVAYGMILYVISVGLSVTMGLMGFINLAHGVFAMAGGYVMVSAMTRFGLPFPLASCARFRRGRRRQHAARASALRRLYTAGELAQVLFTIGLIFVSVAVRAPHLRRRCGAVLLPGYLRGQLHVLGRDFPTYRVFLIAFSIMIVLSCGSASSARAGARWCAPRSTTAPWRSRSASTPRCLFMLTFALGSGLAGLGGALGADILPMQWTYPFEQLVYFLIVVAVGGLGSLRGPFVAALLIGVADTACKYWIPEFGAFWFTRRPSASCCGGRKACSGSEPLARERLHRRSAHPLDRVAALGNRAGVLLPPARIPRARRAHP